ncbi:hypothetical protein L1987_63820 [Smallanthus sonchifolius]|uniref:Uncharacterized protein n=1 Tax=Smallanthus sonchifolius TaxID=185202 RepID=A0ACB9CEA7_9ASTR|nr:hypothetical protein L1987_63820 [Smallanthus sonchifolius]
MEDSAATSIKVVSEEFTFKNKHMLSTKFDEMVTWFLHDYLMMPLERTLPPKVEKGRRVDLLDLYMIVKREGGHKRVTLNNVWAMIGKELGFDWDEGYLMRIIYAQFLDVLEYNYKVQTTKCNALETASKESQNSNQNLHTRSKSANGDQSEDSKRESYAFVDLNLIHCNNQWKIPLRHIKATGVMSIGLEFASVNSPTTEFAPKWTWDVDFELKFILVQMLPRPVVLI